MIDTLRPGNEWSTVTNITTNTTPAEDYDLAGATVTDVIRNVHGVTVLTHTLIVDVGGTATTADGVELVAAAATGQVRRIISRVESAALTAGYYSATLYLTDTDGDTWEIDRQTFMVQSVSLVQPFGGTTLAQLRRSTADRLGDMVVLTATDVGDTSHFVDSLNISQAVSTYNGRVIYVATGDNAGHLARVTATDGSLNRITFTPEAPAAFAVGDEVEVYNERSRGWTLPEYNRAINEAIRDAYPLSKATLVTELSGTFDAYDPVIDIPPEITHLYEVGWWDVARGSYTPVRKGQWYGWIVDGAGQLVIRDWPAAMIHGETLRLIGYGRWPELSKDTDATPLRADYIIKTAMSRLVESGLDREQARGNLVLKYADDAKRARSAIKTHMHADTVRVRS